MRRPTLHVLHTCNAVAGAFGYRAIRYRCRKAAVAISCSRSGRKLPSVSEWGGEDQGEWRGGENVAVARFKGSGTQVWKGRVGNLGGRGGLGEENAG